MELWIRSQDKKKMLKVDNIKWFGGELYANDRVRLETIKDGVVYLLGIYSNGKRALEVFDEIQNALLVNDRYDYSVPPTLSSITANLIYEMPKE